MATVPACRGGLCAGNRRFSGRVAPGITRGAIPVRPLLPKGAIGPANAERSAVLLMWCFRHQLLLPSPYLVLTKPLRLDIQCQRAASVKIGWKYLDD